MGKALASSAVNIGDTATASQYNNLRLDAIYPGSKFGDETDGSKTVAVDEDLDPTNEYNYTDLTIDITKTLSVNSDNTPLVIKITGDCTINGSINLDEKGGVGGARGDGSISTTTNGSNGSNGTIGKSLITGYTNGAGKLGTGGKYDPVVPIDGGGGGDGSGGSSMINDGTAGEDGADTDPVGGKGIGGAASIKIDANKLSILTSMMRGVCCGSGGGGGGGGGGDGSNAGKYGGVGGQGAGAAIINIGGDLILGASSSITAIGGNPVDRESGVSADGGLGGNGAGGVILIIVGGSITNSGVTLSAAQGSGGVNAGVGKIIIYSLEDGTLITS